MMSPVGKNKNKNHDKKKVNCTVSDYEEEEGTGETGEGRVADGFHRVPQSRRRDRRVSACRERFENRAGRVTVRRSIVRVFEDPAVTRNDEVKTSTSLLSLLPCLLLSWISNGSSNP
jgi:hypothetical protein